MYRLAGQLCNRVDGYDIALGGMLAPVALPLVDL